MRKINDTLIDLKYKTNVEANLNASFEEAIKNQSFKEFISKLNLNKEVLIKYTTQLQTSFEEYTNCMNCKNIFDCKNEVKGYAYLPKVVGNTIVFNYVPCKFQKKLLKDTKHYKNMYFENVPEEIKSASMDKIYTKDKNRLLILEYLTSFIKEYPNKKGLYLSGSFGSGKTYLVAATFNELAKKNIKTAIIYWPDFLRNLKGSFNSDFNTKMEYIQKVKLLLIDDIGAENITAWSRDEILGPILQYRMQENLPTFFTSNLNIVELEHHFSTTKDSVDTLKAKRIIERVSQLTSELTLVSKNLRK